MRLLRDADGEDEKHAFRSVAEHVGEKPAVLLDELRAADGGPVPTTLCVRV